MTKVTKTIGRVPYSRGEYQSGTEYYKQNIVSHKGSSFIALTDGLLNEPTAEFVGGKWVVSDGWGLVAYGSELSGIVQDLNDLALEIGNVSDNFKAEDIIFTSGDVPKGSTIHYCVKHDDIFALRLFDNEDNILATIVQVTTKPESETTTSGDYIISSEYKYCKLLWRKANVSVEFDLKNKIYQKRMYEAEDLIKKNKASIDFLDKKDDFFSSIHTADEARSRLEIKSGVGLNTNGDIIESAAEYTTEYYPVNGLKLLTGKRVCFYKKDGSFISYEDHSPSSDKWLPEIPAGSEYFRLSAYNNNIFLGYKYSNVVIGGFLNTSMGGLDNTTFWWAYTNRNIKNRLNSSLYFGKCKLKIPSGFSIFVLESDTYNDNNTAITTYSFEDVREVTITHNYWRISIKKPDNTDFTPEEEVLIRVSFDDSDINQAIDNIYKKELFLDVTIPDIGDYPNVSKSISIKQGSYKFFIERSIINAPLQLVFFKDNLNRPNRIIDIQIQGDYIEFNITSEQANVITGIGLISSRPFVPCNVKIYIINGELSFVNKQNIRNTRNLIGATFFDGWSYRCWLENYRNSNRIYQMSNLYEGSGSLNTPELAEKYEAEFGKKMVLPHISPATGLAEEVGIDGSGRKITSWIDYVWATTGKYPPGSVTFSNWFPEVAYSLRGKTFICGDGSVATFMPPHNHNYIPIRKYTMKDGVTTNGLAEVELGWRNTDTIDQMEAQIDMASHYGIDYFNFCLILTSGMITVAKHEATQQEVNEGKASYIGEEIPTLDKYGNPVRYVDETLFFEGVKDMKTSTRGWAERGNRALVNFLNSKNGYKMKFCLMILSSYKNSSAEDYKIIMDFIYRKFITDSRYLHFNGRPVLLWYSEEYGKDYNTIYHLNRDIIIHFVNKSSNNKFDGSFLYTGGGNATTELDHEDENGYKYYKYKPTIDSAINNTNPNVKMLIPLNIGWHPSQRSNFANNTYCDLHSEEDIVTDYHEILMPTKQEIIDGLKAVFDKYYSGQNDCLILLYAWNECGEGGYLMPNQAEIDSTDPERSGFYKLEAVQEFKNLL